jgi:hypothetical protein
MNNTAPVKFFMGGKHGTVEIGVPLANANKPLPPAVFMVYSPPARPTAIVLSYVDKQKRRVQLRRVNGVGFPCPEDGWIHRGRVYRVKWSADFFY